VENTFGSEAQVTSASITQVGNTFVVEQNVLIACALPSNPVVASQFQVGPLAPGLYSVTANITFTGVDCSPPPITQTAEFAVEAIPGVPTLRRPLEPWGRERRGTGIVSVIF
jgi:hypothetical protein